MRLVTPCRTIRHLVTSRRRQAMPPAPPWPARQQQGLTLIELIVAIAVALVLFTTAIPGYRQFTARNEVAAEVMRIKTALALARNTAVTRRHVIAICPVASPGATHCEKHDWTLPIAILDGHATAGNLNGVNVLRVLEPSGGPTITFNRDYPIRYQSTGWSRGHNGTFTICGRHGDGRKVIVNNMGRVRVGNDEVDGPAQC
ncbi:MAG: GspH/FimT family pseudopilin [Halomonas sp.]|uniref:GspH/FimT family pseudopilin n=1 Tax=Halomonas sp. TaxID=1486246 RepID=UPI0019F4431E|nr:GspH/FimT family pseudopilin [Halomonas sp.]MBE0488270.1 GspH/FimT family pseudopilin [Halomonas sp.]